MELKRFARNDDDIKKKSLEFKAIANFDDYEDDIESLEDIKKDEERVLLFKKYKKFLK